MQLELINPANRDGLLRKIKHETEIKTHVRLQPGQYLHTCMTKLRVDEAADFVGGVWTCNNKLV